MPLAAEFQPLCSAFLNGLLFALGNKLFGLYLYGALTFPESDSIGDIDFHAILNAPLIEAEHTAILQLHTELEQNFPPLGVQLGEEVPVDGLPSPADLLLHFFQILWKPSIFFQKTQYT